MDDGSFAFGRPAQSTASATRPALRTLFLSDLHLGAMGCKADRVLEFLDQHHADTIYLVGDIIDTWRPLGSNWPDSHHEVLRRLGQRAREGVRIVYVPGNHDAFFRHQAGGSVFGFEIAVETTHRTADGRRLLIAHGDCCDVFSDRLTVISKAGSWLETAFRHLGQGINHIRQRLGRDGWDGVEAMLARVNQMLRAYDSFEARISAYARQGGYDGVVCGHFHKPGLHADHGVLYANCGDWVEHCSAMVEHADGRLELIGAPLDAVAAQSASGAHAGVTS